MSVLELGDVVVGGFACVVRQMEAKSEVESENEEVEVVAKSEACTDSKRVEKSSIPYLATHLIGVFTHEPHVSCIDEESSLEGIDDGETVFDIHLQLDVACLSQIEIQIVILETSWTNTTNREGTYAVGTTHIKEFVVGRSL